MRRAGGQVADHLDGVRDRAGAGGEQGEVARHRAAFHRQHQLALRMPLDAVHAAVHQAGSGGQCSGDAREVGLEAACAAVAELHDGGERTVPGRMRLQPCAQVRGQALAQRGQQRPRGVVAWRAEHLPDGALFGDASSFEHHHLVGDLADHAHLVRDQDDGDAQAAVDVPEQLQDGVRGFRVQRRRGLVAQQDFRVRGQGACDAHALLLPAGQPARVAAVLVLQAHEFQEFIHPPRDLRRAGARHAQRQGDVVEHRLGGQQVEMLEDHADAAAQRDQSVVVQRADVHAVDEHLPVRRRLQPVDGAQQAGFARAAAADDAEDAAGRDVQVDVLQRGHVTRRGGIYLADAAQRDGPPRRSRAIGRRGRAGCGRGGLRGQCRSAGTPPGRGSRPGSPREGGCTPQHGGKGHAKHLLPHERVQASE